MKQWDWESSSLCLLRALKTCLSALFSVMEPSGHLLTLTALINSVSYISPLQFAPTAVCLPHIQYIPHAISSVCGKPILPLPPYQAYSCNLSKPKSLPGFGVCLGLRPSLTSPSGSEWHCPTLDLTTGSSERGFFGSWCSCDLGSPGKTKSSLRAGAGSSRSLVSPRQGSAHSGRSKLLIAWQGDGLDDLWGHTQPPDSAV